MAQYILVFSVLLGFVACSTTSDKSSEARSTSIKGIVEPKKEVSCSAIPTNRDKDLAAKQIKFLHVPPFGFYFGIQQRSGKMGHFFSEFDPNLKLEREAFKQRSYGDNSLFIGFLPRPRKINVVISNLNPKTESSFVEIRDLASNKVIFTSHPLGVNITDGQAFSAKDGVWLIFNKESERAFALFLRDQGDGRWRVEYSLRDPEMMEAHVSLSQENNLIMALAKKNKKDSISVKVIEVDPLKKQKQEFAGDIAKSDAPLESWAITSLGNKVGFAAVVGDSLVGGAQLYTATLERNQNKLFETWHKVYSLKDRHVGSPFFMQPASMMGNPVSESTVGLISWVTDEAFLETFRLDQKRTGAQTAFSGLRPNSLVMESMVEAKQGRAVISVRQKKDDKFLFEVCSLSL